MKFLYIKIYILYFQFISAFQQHKHASKYVLCTIKCSTVTFLQNPNEDTEWNDILRSKGILPPKEKEVTEDDIVNMLEKTIEDKQKTSEYHYYYFLAFNNMPNF